MEIDVAERWEIEHPLRDHASVTHNDNRVWSESCQLGAELAVIFDFVRLGDWQSEFERALFDGRDGRFQAPALRSIGLGHDQTDVESSRREFFERRDCEVGRAAENELKGGRHSVIAQSDTPAWDTPAIEPPADTG